MLAAAGLAFVACGRVHPVAAGKYQVADREYSSQNYVMERAFTADSAFQERHIVDHCLLMEMGGHWTQKGGTMTLDYDRLRNRKSCRDSLPAWDKDSLRLTIPVRNVEATSYESLLAASDGKPEKWIKWLRQD